MKAAVNSARVRRPWLWRAMAGGLLLAVLGMVAAPRLVVAQSAGREAAERLPPLPLPPGLEAEIIAPHMRMNGSPMQITRLPVQDLRPVEKFYREYFERHAEGKAISDRVFQGRRLLAAMVDKRLITVEMLPEGDGHSVLVSSLVPERIQAPADLAKRTPRMPGSEVLQVLESIEPVGRHVTTSMRNRFGVDANAYYLRAQLLLVGWTRVRDDTVQSGQHRQIRFSREGGQLMVDIQKQSEDTLIVMNETQ